MIGPIALILSVGVLFFAYLDVEAWRSRNAIREFLDAPDGDFDVSVNSRSWGADSTALAAIRGIHRSTAHHSHPEHLIAVGIQGKRGLLELAVARDSDDPNEYWVFWARQAGKDSRMEIGRVETSVFKGE